MFRDMRRKAQELTREECIEILKKATNGVLSVLGDDSYPYGVPLSYVYMDGKIYFHCAKTGHKLDAIKNSDKVCFTVVAQDDIKPEEFTTYFKSVVAFGRARIMDEDETALNAHIVLSEKYACNVQERLEEELKRAYSLMYMVEVELEHITGKQAKELAKSNK
ncbi:MAG: pyridoxamine 5'-phosphate oxidase family protein [Clostridiales bacterium]|nr:pyridoxamine 5'-phosphate oxidase family protein [Clostridiales bacterium]